MKHLLNKEIDTFLARKAERESFAARRLALYRAVGKEPEELAGATGPERDAIARRLARQIRRERIKGLRQPWQYDLDRHIALKGALQQLLGKEEPRRRTQSQHGKRGRGTPPLPPRASS